MSTTVSYKGETLTTVNNTTKTLETKGTWLEDDLTLVDVSGGGSTLITKNISANGTYNASSDSADGYSQVNVAVPASAVDSGTKNITANGNGQDVVGYAAVNVNVPNSYSAGDEGKVVSNGALVAQTAHADVTPSTSDQTIDTTTNNSIKVKGDADLVAANIKKDVEIFGVTGSYEGGGGGGTPISAEGITVVDANESVYPATGYNALINVSKKPTLIHSWDFKQGLVDSVGGLTATLANGATQSSSGVLIGGATQYVQIPVPFAIRHTYEIDITSLNKQFSSGHGRIWDIANGEGLIAQNGTTLKYYSNQGTIGAWSTENGGTDLSILNGKTLTIKAGRIIKSVTVGGNPVEYACFDNYIDGNFWFSTSIGHSSVTGVNQYMRIGESSASFYNATVTGFRIYEGVNY